MLVTLTKKDLVLHCFNDDIEKYKSDRERNNYKKTAYLPRIRQTIFLKFEKIFGVSECQLLEKFTLNGEKIDKRFVQCKIKNAVGAFFYKKDEPEEMVIGEFERMTNESEGNFYQVVLNNINNHF